MPKNTGENNDLGKETEGMYCQPVELGQITSSVFSLNYCYRFSLNIYLVHIVQLTGGVQVGIRDCSFLSEASQGGGSCASATLLAKSGVGATLADPEDDMEEWRQCGRWLIDCKVLPPNHRVVWPSAVVFDLAQALRDGVLLCQMLHNLSPGSVDLKQINFRPQMSQVR